MKKEIISHSEKETLDLASELGKNSKRGDVFALTGDLGAGKTVIARGIARGIGVDDDITSPTFTIMETYEGIIPLYHFDLYRIENELELDLLYFEEFWEGQGLSVIEWAERAGDRLPDNTVTLTIEYIDNNSRRITIEYPDH